jgi:membrane protease YdiL (CAAX protease family)
LFAIFYFVVIRLGVALVHRVAVGHWPPFGQTPVYIMMFAMMVSTPIQAGEEIGWRGYALPRLAEKFGLGGASVILGLVWASWHLPLFFLPGTDSYGQSFIVYLLAVTALSVALAWLYWRTNGSLFLTMLMHAAINNTAGIVSPAPRPGTSPFALDAPFVAWATAALLWIAAVYFLIRMRRATLVATEPR